MRTDATISGIIAGSYFRPKGHFYVDLTGGGSYTEIPTIAVAYSSKLNNPIDGLANMGSMTQSEISATIANTGGAYSFLKPSGGYNMYNKKVKFEFGYDVAGVEHVELVFSGQITRFDEDDKGLTVKLTCKDYGRIITSGRRSSTILYANKRVDQWLAQLVIEANHNGAGMTFETHGYGMFSIPWVWLEDELIYDAMVQAANAEGGVIYVDEFNKLHYWSPYYWAIDPPHKTPQWTITDNSDFTAMTLTWNEREQIDDVYVQYQPRSMGPPKEVFKLDRPIIIPAGRTVFVTFKFSEPVDEIYAVDTAVIDAGGNGDMAQHLSYNSYTTAPQIDPAIDDKIFAEHWDMTLYNDWGIKDAYLTKFTVVGRSLIGSTDEQYKASQTSDNSKHIHRISGNPYLQTREQSEFLAQLIKDRFSTTPRMTASIAGVKPNCLLEVGDCIGVTSANAQFTNRAFYVMSINASSPEYKMTLELMDATGFFLTGNYFIIGDGTHGVLNDSNSLLFY